MFPMKKQLFWRVLQGTNRFFPIDLLWLCVKTEGIANTSLIRRGLTTRIGQHQGKMWFAICLFSRSQVKSSQVKPFKSSYVISSQVKSGQVRSGQVRSGQVRSGQDRSGQVKLSQVKSIVWCTTMFLNVRAIATRDRMTDGKLATITTIRHMTWG